MQIHQLKRKNKNKKSRQVGRGGKRGKTSGRGTKGQKARAGRKMRPEMRDIIKKIPKRRGYGKNRAKSVNSSVASTQVVNLILLEKYFSNDDKITRETLVKKGLIKSLGKVSSQIKILGMGDITKKIFVSGISVSKSAREKIEKSGGKIT